MIAAPESLLSGESNISAHPSGLICDGLVAARVVDVDEGVTTLEATWHKRDGTPVELGGTVLYGLMDTLAPVPGYETQREVIDNLAGVNELRQNRPYILDLHRQMFGESWGKIALSRRLLQTVLEGRVVPLTYDESVDIRAGQARERKVVEQDKQLLVYSATHAYYKSLRGKDELAVNSDRGDAAMAEIGYRLMHRIFDRRVIDFHVGDDEHMFRDQWFNFRFSEEESAVLYDEAVSDMDPDRVKDTIDVYFAARYEEFQNKDSVPMLVIREWKSEEDITAQGHYHQRRPVRGYNFQMDIAELVMEYPYQDEPWTLGIEGTGIADRDAADYTGSVVRPVLRWQVGEAIEGGRRLVGNDELPPDYVVERSDHLSYADTATALMILALSQPQIRDQWPKSYQFEGEKNRITIGAAQVPLLALWKERAILDSHEGLHELERRAGVVW